MLAGPLNQATFGNVVTSSFDSIRSSARSFILALCNWDLLFPMEQPNISAISLCS